MSTARTLTRFILGRLKAIGEWLLHASLICICGVVSVGLVDRLSGFYLNEDLADPFFWQWMFIPVSLGGLAVYGWIWILMDDVKRRWKEASK